MSEEQKGNAEDAKQFWALFNQAASMLEDLMKNPKGVKRFVIEGAKFALSKYIDTLDDEQKAKFVESLEDHKKEEQEKLDATSSFIDEILELLRGKNEEDPSKESGQ